jgi:hypothetical protein
MTFNSLSVNFDSGISGPEDGEVRDKDKWKSIKWSEIGQQLPLCMIIHTQNTSPTDRRHGDSIRDSDRMEQRDEESGKREKRSRVIDQMIRFEDIYGSKRPD